MPTGLPPIRAKPTTMLGRVVLVDFQKLFVVHHLIHHVADVVGAAGVLRHNIAQIGLQPVSGIVGRVPGRGRPCCCLAGS